MSDNELVTSSLPGQRPAPGDDSVLLAAIFASSAEGIAFIDGDLVIRRANAAFAAQLHLPLEQIEGRLAAEVIPGWAEQVGSIYQRIRETGVPFQATAFPFAFKDQPERGTTYWDSSIAPAYGPDGAFRGYLLLQREVTDRVRAGQQLQEAFEREQAQREELQTQNEELQTQQEELQTQSEEIQSQQEELQAQNEELVATNAALLQAQQALALSEAHYRRIVETTLEGVWQIDADGKTAFVNERLAAMLGYSVEEMLRRSRFDFMDEEGRRVAEEKVERRRQGLAEQYDLKLRRKDGTDLWTIVAASPVFDAEGNYAGVLWMVSDITERKRAEVESARLAAIVQYSEDPIIGKTLDGIITSWNPAAERHYGYQATEAVGQPISVIVPPDCADDRIGRGERVEHFETVRVRKDGQRVDVSLSIAPIRDGSGRLVGASTIASDITDRKMAEEERERLLEQLQLEQERWRATVESMLDLVAVSDAQGRVTYINPAYSRHIGYLVDPSLPLEEHPKYYKLYHPDGTMYAPDELPLQRAALTGEDMHDVEVVERTADGREFVGVFNAAPLRDAEGRFVGAVVVGRDVTEARRAEAERERLTEETRRLADQVIRQQQFTDRVLSNIPEAISYLDKDLIYRMINASAAGFLARPADQIIGHHLREIAGEGTAVYRGVESVLRTGRPYEATLRFAPPHHHEQEKSFEVAYFPDTDEDGRVRGVFGTGHEVTRLVELQEATQRRAEEMEALLDSMTEGVFIARADGTIMSVNQAAAALYGVGDAESLLKQIPRLDSTFGIVYPEQGNAPVPAEDRPLSRVVRGESFTNLLARVRRSDTGQQWYLSYSGAPLRDEQGNITLGILAVRDVTTQVEAQQERERLLEQLREANEQLILASTRAQERAAELDSTIGAMADGVMILDAAGSITRVNEGALRLLGVAAEAARRPGFHQQVATMDVQRADGSRFPPAELPGQRAMHGETVQGVVMGLRQPSGMLVWVSASAAPIKGPAGQIRGAVSTFTDITQLRKLEEDREDFVRAVSHDLRQPLTIVGGQAQMVQRLLEKKGIDGRIQGSLEAIRTSAGRMGRMIADLVQSARREAGQL
ncbi:MAG: PAS domain S-box protein, partial [Chloroflexota bacterium]